MKDFSRAELSDSIRDETARLVLLTAMLFLSAGSLWAHFALGGIFVEPSFLTSWALIHLCGFLALKFPRLERIIVASALVGLQLYFHTCFKRLELPYLPLAPIFFVVSVISMTAYVNGSFLRFALAWSSCWASSWLWIKSIENPSAPVNTALLFGFVLNLIFFVGFFLASWYSRNIMTRKMDLLGGRQNYDTQRLHAAKLQTLGELAAGIAHEINNPLASINGYSHQIKGELLESNPPNVELLASANDRIKFNVDRIIEITKALRSFSRAPSDDLLSKVSIRAVVEDSVALIRSSLKSEKVDLHLELPEEEAHVNGNFVLLSQVLVNLVSNARDACKNSDRKKVSIGFSSNAEEVKVWIEDTGPGIAREISKDIFRAFFTTKDVHKGTGLGLYISQMIAEKHHAQLSFHCPKDPNGRVLGTRFELKLAKYSEVKAKAA